jgi:hypothetical protein
VRKSVTRRISRLLAGDTLAARDGLEDLYLFAGTGVLDNMPDVDDAIVAGVGTLEAGVMRLYGVGMILDGWVRGLRGRLIHVNTSSVLAAPPGSCYSCGGFLRCQQLYCLI